MTAKSGRSGFVTGGTWCADHNKLIEKWPLEEDLSIIYEDKIRGGGSACNFAVNIKRLDPIISVETTGLLGDDADGDMLLQQAKVEGLDCSGLIILPKQRTAFTDAFTARDSGKRTHLYYPGTSSELTPEHFNFSGTSARIIHLGLPGLHEKMDSAWKDDANGWVTV